MINDFKIRENFKLSEFQSSDTGEVKIDSRLLDKLQQLREKIGKPVIVTSGYRTPAHNQRVGGHPNSYHMQGLAADIVVAGMTSREIATVAREVGFTGIGVYPTRGHCHVDVRPGPAVFFNGEKPGESPGL